jgi:hypothetical protein
MADRGPNTDSGGIPCAVHVESVRFEPGPRCGKGSKSGASRQDSAPYGSPGSEAGRQAPSIGIAGEGDRQWITFKFEFVDQHGVLTPSHRYCGKRWLREVLGKIVTKLKNWHLRGSVTSDPYQRGYKRCGHSVAMRPGPQ